MSEYTKPCNTCKVEIIMSNNSGKWLPYDLDGSPHRCGEKKEKENKPLDNSSKSVSIEDRLQKLELAVFGATK